MADAVRFAIVGLGMGRGRADRCKETRGAELAAICDLSEDRGTVASSELGVPWVQNYDDLLAREDVDVIGLWTPSGTHAAMAVRALEAGKHVCMTKPMDITTEACDRSIHEADKRGLLLGIDFQERYLPANHQVKQAISTGAIGRLLRADLRMHWFRGQAYYDAGMPQSWRSRLDTEGGSLANQAVHFVDLLLWWAGTPERVVGFRGTYGHEIETEDGTTAVVQFRDGAAGSIVTTTCAVPNRGHEVMLSGTWGTLTWGNVDEVTLEHVPEEVRSATDAFRVEGKLNVVRGSLGTYPIPVDLPENIFEDMVGSIQNGSALQCDGHEARRSVALFEAVYRSSDTGSWVEV